MGRHESLVFGLAEMRSAEGQHWIQIKNYKLQCFTLTSWCLTLFFRKAQFFFDIKITESGGLTCSYARNLLQGTVPAVGADLKINPKVRGHAFADLCQHSRVRWSFWDISGWIRPLQSNKHTSQILICLKSRVCLRNDFSFHSSLINPWLCSLGSFPLDRQVGQQQSLLLFMKWILDGNFKLNDDLFLLINKSFCSIT